MAAEDSSSASTSWSHMDESASQHDESLAAGPNNGSRGGVAVMAFQAPHTERSFARQEAHWQRNTMQPLSIVMIVIWSFWRAKLGQSSSPAAKVKPLALLQMLLPLNLPLVGMHLGYVIISWLGLLPWSRDRLAAFAHVADILFAMVVQMVLAPSELPLSLRLCYSVHGWFILLAKFRLSTAVLLHALHIESIVFIEMAGVLQGKSIPASAAQLVLLISICTVAPLVLSTVLEGSSRMKFLHTHKLPLTCLGTFWQHRLIQRVLASRLLHKAAHSVPGNYTKQQAN
eukprot:jgi/Astpho2/356/Aster-02233